MLAENDVGKIQQYKLDALCAILLHEKWLDQLTVRSKFLDFLTIAVPILYVVPRFAAKGTEAHMWVELVWEVIAALLLALAVWKVAMSWDERAKKHFHLMRRNQALRTEADQLLSNVKRVSLDRLIVFLEKARELEVDDSEMLTGFSKTEEQRIYREALRQDNPGAKEVLCPHCQSPTIVHFKSGSCPRCGGTPVSASK